MTMARESGSGPTPLPMEYTAGSFFLQAEMLVFMAAYPPAAGLNWRTAHNRQAHLCVCRL